MAKTRDIRTRVAFEGETEYKKVVSDIAAEHKKLNNELKAAQAEFKATGNAEKMFEEKSKLLNKQIEAQNKAIKTAEDALKKLKDNGVDKSSAAWVYWEKELTSAKTAMFNATAELNKLNSEFGNVTTATERATQETADYSETLKSIDKGVKFGNILNGLRVVKDAVGGVISTALRMGKALVMSQISGGDWAREIMMGAAKAGVSVEEYQARLYAQAVGGINTDAITEGVKKTTENLATTDTELLKLYNDLGISTRNADSTVRDATETFWDSVDALKGIEDQTTRSIYAQKLLGDQYLELRGLVDLGSEGYEKLIAEGKASATVTEESVNALADMDAAVEKVNSTAQSLMHNINAELAPGFTAVAEAIGSTLTRFDEFLKTEEGKAVFDNWNTSLANLAQTIQDTDFKAALEGIANVVNAIAEAFKIIIEGAKLVKSDVEFIADLLFTDTKPIITAIATGDKNSAQNANEAKGAKNAIGSRGIVKITERTIADEAQEIKSLLEVLNLESDLAKVGQTLKAAQSNAAYASVLSVDNIADKWQSFIDGIDSGRINNAWASMSEIFELQKLIDSFIESIGEVEQSAESGGGDAMTAFNAAIEKGTQDTQSKLKSGVTAAFSGMDSLFASMGTAHGSAYINALSAQMARINSMLSLTPSYAYGGVFSSGLPAYASPTSTSNFSASIYVGREKFADITTPIVNARMGAELESMR